MNKTQDEEFDGEPITAEEIEKINGKPGGVTSRWGSKALGVDFILWRA